LMQIKGKVGENLLKISTSLEVSSI